MKREEILEKVEKKKAVVGEMEKEKLGKGSFIALICAGVIAVAFMIIEGALGHFTSIYAIASVCYGWAAAFYFCQYFIAKRPWQVLIGAVLHTLAFVAMVVLFIIYSI